MDTIGSGQKALLDIFARVCTAINNEEAQHAVEEVGRADAPSLSNYLDSLRTKTSLVDELKLQNETLRAELAEAVQELENKRKEEIAKELATVSITSRAQTPISSINPLDSSTKVDRGISPIPDDVEGLDLSDPAVAVYMKAKYRRVKKQRDEIVEAKDKAVTAWRRERATRSHYQGLADNLQKRLDESIESATQAIDPTRAIEAKSDDEVNVPPSSPPQLSIQADLPTLPREKTLAVVEETATVQRHSDSTESGSDRPVVDIESAMSAGTLPVLVKEESAELPVVVSSRVVKKRNASRMEPSLESHLTARVKLELLSSSPTIGVARYNKLITHESMDLDDAGPPTVTPKKSRYVDARVKTIARLQRSKTSFIEEDATPSKGLEYHNAMKTIHNDHVRQHVSVTKFGQPRVPLAPRDANRDHLPRTITAPASSRKRRRLDEVEAGAAIFGEDGESPSLKKPIQRNVKAIDMSDEVRSRLDSLLQVPSPQKAVLHTASSRAGVPTHSPSVHRVALVQAGSLSDDDEAKITVRKMPTAYQSDNELAKRTLPRVDGKRSTNLSNVLGDDSRTAIASPVMERRGSKTADRDVVDEAIDPSHEPFRSRPLSRLSREHFRINKAYNQGVAYPYTSVTRGREERKCLEGCTRPECCGGKFREWVEFTTDENAETTLSQEERDQVLLEEFLGGNKGKLANMNGEQRTELLKQARTREMAKRHSKHRTTYERRCTPPGYWNADFPDTQEQQAIREEAHLREREIVEERYNDAMREGGKWLFKDE